MASSAKFDDNISKKAFIEAFKKSFGNITQSSKAAGIDRQTYYNWMNQDVDFKYAIENIQPDELFLDFVESKLVQKINDGDTACIIFTLKTKGKKRGYVEHSIIEVESEKLANVIKWFGQNE